MYAEKSPSEEEAAVRDAQQWRAKMWEAGLGWITGPPEYGGRGLGPEYERAYLDLEVGYRVPSQDHVRQFFGGGGPHDLGPRN